MKMTIVAVGRLKAGPHADLFNFYAGRIQGTLDVIEVDDKKSLGKKAEGDLILAKIPDGAMVVALDEKGSPISSPDFAQKIDQWRQNFQHIIFVIGGADGLDDRVVARSAFSLSLGKMVWPHLLVRGMLTEQIYRAQSILNNHPYHRV